MQHFLLYLTVETFFTENLRGTQLGSPILTAYPTAVIVVSLNQYPMSILH